MTGKTAKELARTPKPEFAKRGEEWDAYNKS